MNARSGTLTNDHLQPRILSVSLAVNFRQQNSEAALDVLLGERVGYADGERVVVQINRYDSLEPYPSEETSISFWTSPRRRPHSSSACGSGTGAGGGGGAFRPTLAVLTKLNCPCEEPTLVPLRSRCACR